jgi:peptidoglycan/xylan/chitin deacetylase (PgdA/CDA1 family)
MLATGRTSTARGFQLHRDLSFHIGFHGVGTPERELEPDEGEYWIGTSCFEQILDFLTTQTNIEISFDDGNKSDVDIALPALLDRGLRGSFFPIAGRIGQPGSVDRSGLRALVAQGMTVGSHGMYHQSWRGLSRKVLEEELVTARAVISTESGAPVTTAACPLGSYDRRSLKRLRELGYERVFTSDRSPARPQAWLQPRYSVYKSDEVSDVRAIVGARPNLRKRMTTKARITAKQWR